MAAAPIIVALEGVSRHYDDGRVAALTDVTLEVTAGDFLAVTGPSGSGKSTLLHLACGLDRPTSGRVVFEGAVPASQAAWARLRARRVGFVFQDFNLLPTLTAVENVEVAMFGVHRAASASASPSREACPTRGRLSWPMSPRRWSGALTRWPSGKAQSSC